MYRATLFTGNLGFDMKIGNIVLFIRMDILNIKLCRWKNGKVGRRLSKGSL